MMAYGMSASNGTPILAIWSWLQAQLTRYECLSQRMRVCSCGTCSCSSSMASVVGHVELRGAWAMRVLVLARLPYLHIKESVRQSQFNTAFFPHPPPA